MVMQYIMLNENRANYIKVFRCSVPCTYIQYIQLYIHRIRHVFDYSDQILAILEILYSLWK